VAPWSQTGGLADVAGALPAALERSSGGQVQAAAFSPLYMGMHERIAAAGATLEDTGVTVHVPLAGYLLRARFWAVRTPGYPPVYLLDYPGFYQRKGIYANSVGVDHADNHLRYALLCRAVIEAAPQLMGGVPNIFHGHDWQSGLLPVYLRTRYRHYRSATVFTIHNLAYQGVFHKDVLPELGLDWSVFHHDRMEYFDAISLLKAGIAYSDVVTTVSPSYAREILTTPFGHGLDGFLRSQKYLLGILNGIDDKAWDPETDPHLPANYSADTTAAGKAECRRRLAEEFHLPVRDDELLLAVVSRLTPQKGVDLVADLVPLLHRLGARLVVLGSGSPARQDRFRYLANAHGEHISMRVGFDDDRATVIATLARILNHKPAEAQMSFRSSAAGQRSRRESLMWAQHVQS
jgi:starch synthase